MKFRIAAVAFTMGLMIAGVTLAQDKPPYTVTDGNRVDAGTMKGFRVWREAACDRCHGANQEGMVGPSLIKSLKSQNKQEFAEVVLKGRLEKGT